MHRYRHPIIGWSVHASNSFHICASIPISLLRVPLYKSSVLPAIFPFAFPQLFLSFFLSLPSLPFARQAHDPPLPMTHSLMCTSHVQHQKVCRGLPLALSAPSSRQIGVITRQKCHHVGNCCWCCRGRPSASFSHLHIIMFFHGHGKGRGGRGRVRGLAERGN